MYREADNAPKSHLLNYSKKHCKLTFIITLMHYICFIVPKGF